MTDYLCLLSKEEIKNIKKNPHTGHFFCEIENIIDCNQDECKNKKGLRYSTKNDKIIGKSNIDKQQILDLYYQKNIIEKILENNKSIEYQSRSQRPTTTIHWGQLKLFLSTLQFLLYYAPRSQKVYIVYPGSASGFNINLLSKMFPQCYWYLIDPNPFYKELKKNPHILEIRNEYFTNELAEYYKKLLNEKYTLFISDIRTTIKDQFEDDINENNKWQKEWVDIIKPDYAQLKFRIPRNESNEYEYFDGECYLQIYPPHASTETRLVVKKNAKIKLYKLDEYENQLYYHNRILRASVYPYKENIKGLDHCYDCAAFVSLIRNYIYKYRKIEKRNINNLIKDILKKLVKYNKIHLDTKKILNNIQE